MHHHYLHFISHLPGQIRLVGLRLVFFLCFFSNTTLGTNGMVFVDHVPFLSPNQQC